MLAIMAETLMQPSDYPQANLSTSFYSTKPWVTFNDFQYFAHLQPYTDISAPCILLSLMTIALNIFVIKFYWKNKLTVVPLLYTLIATADIFCSAGIIYQSIIASLFTDRYGYISTDTVDKNAAIFYTLIQISYRCSVFYNLVLAVSRTIMILRPFYQVNLKMIKLACFLYTLPWILLCGMKIQVYNYDYTMMMISKVVILKGFSQFSDQSFDEIGAIIASLGDILAFVIPVIIVLITCIIQIVSIRRSKQFPTSSNQRHVTITVLLMSALFVVCNSAFSVYTCIIAGVAGRVYIYMWIKFGSKEHKIMIAVFSILLPILNAALNPVIIIYRSSGMRGKFAESVRKIVVRARRE